MMPRIVTEYTTRKKYVSICCMRVSSSVRAAAGRALLPLLFLRGFRGGEFYQVEQVLHAAHVVAFGVFGRVDVAVEREDAVWSPCRRSCSLRTGRP